MNLNVFCGIIDIIKLNRITKMEEKQEQVKSSRGKFKPEMRNLSNEDVKEILLQKISEEELSVPESEDDNILLSKIDSKEDKFNCISI